MGSSAMPPDLLRAVADRRGQVAVVVGAGCSLESPTDLLLSSAYSERAFESLKRNGVLEDGDCDPADLSEVASAVFAREQSQAPLVQALPREKYQHARPNLGHLLAVALMAEGAISCIATLNFDMALSNAITQLQVTEIATVAGHRRTCRGQPSGSIMPWSARARRPAGQARSRVASSADARRDRSRRPRRECRSGSAARNGPLAAEPSRASSPRRWIGDKDPVGTHQRLGPHRHEPDGAEPPPQSRTPSRRMILRVLRLAEPCPRRETTRRQETVTTSSTGYGQK